MNKMRRKMMNKKLDRREEIIIKMGAQGLIALYN
jgi:hypothetical protein